MTTKKTNTSAVVAVRNKHMSYRTDRLLDEIGNAHGFVNQRNCPKKWVGLALELEDELYDATFEIERLKDVNLQLREGIEELKQRIHQLETENDALRADLLLWSEKEAKP